MNAPGRRKVGAKHRSSRGDSSKSVRLMAKRKNIMRQIQGLDPEKDMEEIGKLQKKADFLLERAQKMEMTLKDAYNLALCQ